MTTRGRAAVAVRPQSQAEFIDRALVIACAVIWLVVLGVGVAATVALVDLGSGHPRGVSGGTDPDTPWLLYGVIGVSAAVIALAIPLLLRARRVATDAEPARAVSRPQPRQVADNDPPDYPGPTPARYSTSIISAAELDRMWLRCGIGVLTATGAAMAAVAMATYLMAVDMTGAAWAAYIVAAVITVATTAIPVLYLRQLRDALAAQDD
jgi:hypothetical protein